MARLILNTPSESSSSEIADWLEIVMLGTRRRILSPGKARDLLAGSGSSADDLDVALAFSVLHSRCDLELAHYPFRFSRLGLERKEEVPESPYAFLVLVASASDGGISLDAPGNVSVLLERLVTVALRNLFGLPSQSIRFGFPPEPGRPTDFQDAIGWLAAQLKARALPLAGSSFLRNDGGIDVVVHRQFQDSHPGLIAVVQVSAGEDLRGKSLEIAGNDLDRWIRIPRPVAVLASPIDAGRDPDLTLEIGTRVVFLDRWRLIDCLDVDVDIGADLSAWSNSVLESLTL